MLTAAPSDVAQFCLFYSTSSRPAVGLDELCITSDIDVYDWYPVLQFIEFDLCWQFYL